jgi:ribosome maturation factor RimP
MDARATADSISRLVTDALAGTGVVVDDVSVQQAGRRRLVRVFVARDVSDVQRADDRTSPVEPLSLDEVAQTTRTVSDTLDAGPTMGEAPYTLEVSSTGVDRPLRTVEHFRRNVGRLITLTHADGTSTTDRLVSVGPDGIGLAADPDRQLPFGQITTASVQVEFARADREDH